MTVIRFHTFLSSCLEVGGDCLFLSYMEALFYCRTPTERRGVSAYNNTQGEYENGSVFIALKHEDILHRIFNLVGRKFIK